MATRDTTKPKTLLWFL